jgi:hypothetical protein
MTNENSFSNDNIKSVDGSNLPSYQNNPQNNTKTNTSNLNNSSNYSSWKSSLINLFNLRKDFWNMNWSEIVHECRNSRRLVLLVVFIALFFDNMLLTTVVPIIPEYLFELDHPNETAEFELLYRLKNITDTYNSPSYPDFTTAALPQSPCKYFLLS